MTQIIDPPISIGNEIQMFANENDGTLKLYITFDYLSARTFSTILKTINDLYVTVFEVLHNEKPSTNEQLVIEYIKTGNSIDVVINALEKLVTSKRGRGILVVVVGLIGGKIMYDSHRTTQAELANKKADTEWKWSQKSLTDANIKKTDAETKQINYETYLREQKFKQDSIDRMKNINNQKKVRRKQNGFSNAVKKDPAIYQVTINGDVFYQNKINITDKP